MSTLSDVQALYGSVQDTWTKSQAHVIAHVVLAGVVFGVCGATIPELRIEPDALKAVLNSEWYKLTKDTGVVYAFLVVPVVLLAAYAGLLRAGGQLVVAVVMVVFSPSRRANPYRLLTPWALEPLALYVENSDFSLSELQTKSSEPMLKYQSHVGALTAANPTGPWVVASKRSPRRSPQPGDSWRLMFRTCRSCSPMVISPPMVSAVGSMPSRIAASAPGVVPNSRSASRKYAFVIGSLSVQIGRCHQMTGRWRAIPFPQAGLQWNGRCAAGRDRGEWRHE